MAFRAGNEAFKRSVLTQCFFYFVYPLKVHVWAGISIRGPTKICVFDGIMNAELYVEILRATLVPFITEKYAEGHRIMTRSILRG